MSGILRLESLTKGNTLKQGDKTALKYRLFDADGDTLDIAGKTAKVRLVYPDFLTIGYEKDGLTVAQDDTVTFTIDSVIPSRIYHVEIIVDEQFIFPSRADESKFTVDKSSLGTETNIIEIVGKDILIQEVKSQVDTELQPLVTSLESAQQAELERVEAEQERVQSYQEIQQLIEDGVEPEDGSITSWKLASNSVTPKATNFIERSSNLLNPNDLIEGYAIISSSGELDVNNNYYATKFIEVEKGLSYSTGGFNRVAYYSEAKGFVGYEALTVDSSVFDVPENAYFVRLHGTKENLNNFQMNEGATLLPKEDYYIRLVDDVKTSEKSFREHKVSKEQLPEKIIESKHVDFLKPSTNLYLYNPDLRGIGLVLVTGEEYIHEDYTSSDFIEVIQGAKYTYSEKVAHIHYYDSNKNKIGSTIYNTSDPQVITSIAEGVFVRIQFNHRIATWEDIQINLGEELLAYDKGGETLDKNIRINAKSIEGMEDVFNHDWVTDYPLIVDTDFDKEFNCPDLVDMGSTSPDPLNDYKAQDFYDLYDQLVANYPDYVTRTFLGNDASGTIPIYRYDFRPKEVITSSMAEGNLQLTKFPKVILASGSHPEKTAAWCLYESMKQITTRWNEDESLEDLRWNVHFIVIPFFNPWGYDNGHRYNYNEVNIGRNFPHKFVVTEPGMATWGGTEPLSEPESQYLYNTLMENQDALCHIDYHNMGHTNNFIWIQPVSDFGLAVAKSLIRKMTRKWKKERGLDAPSDLYNGYVGYTNRADHGTNLTFAETLGMRSATFEVTLYDLWHPERQSYNSQNLTLGTEAFVNYVNMMLRETIKEKNAGL